MLAEPRKPPSVLDTIMRRRTAPGQGGNLSDLWSARRASFDHGAHEPVTIAFGYAKNQRYRAKFLP
jgi:hypothetical protein